MNPNSPLWSNPDGLGAVEELPFFSSTPAGQAVLEEPKQWADETR